ncbi:TetR/AcrR family transcriptional regulator [Maribacter polysiphoniae]|uniref:TetR family transcriptional regulator n=1 Tax=Maribacter polysiphoniae TaxID=429344 RepID=A0A316E5B3_9FLAO|nr:TetR/AcrR family transcriptional regulator [Maribacter polysiphoniae]MBD1259005.1 TetR/AcrR family transcriptional regulator [Maribacter polysiphoniae]PWK24559.1 TetR family transcriptional regulator [Maribacter polysiphoniae]
MDQRLKSELTRQLILNESFKLFYENGFKTTSVDKIMKATNLTKGAFYHHFENKKALGLAVIGLKLQKRVYEAMVAPLYGSGDALEILKTIFSVRLKSFTVYEKQHGCPANNFINEIGDQEFAYQNALKRIIEEWKSALVYVLDRGKTEGSVRKDICSKSVAVYLISAFEGVRGLRKLYDNDLILDEYISGLSLYIKQISAS